MHCAVTKGESYGFNGLWVRGEWGVRGFCGRDGQSRWALSWGSMWWRGSSELRGWHVDAGEVRVLGLWWYGGHL